MSEYAGYAGDALGGNLCGLADEILDLLSIISGFY